MNEYGVTISAHPDRNHVTFVVKAESIGQAAVRQRAVDALIAAVSVVLFAVTKDADAHDGRVDRDAVAEICRDALAKAGAL